jgi:hypothetical protein
MHYRFLAEAAAEYVDAIEYYERVKPGLGDTFVRDVESAARESWRDACCALLHS